MRVLVVDDEAPARRRLTRLLAAVGDLTVAGEAADAETALAQIAALAPDLVLLDIQLPGLDGLALAASHAALPPIIFVTAHAEFAVRAFELDAIDYLVKPVRPERLAAAIERARRRAIEQPRPAPPAPSPASPRTRIVVIERGALRLFDARDVTRFWARDKYTLFHSAGDEHLTLEALSTLSARLEPVGFMRVHRGELINVARVRALRVEAGQHVADLDDGQAARISRRVLAAFKAALRV